MKIRNVISFTAVLWVLTFSLALGEENWQMNLYLNTFSGEGDGGGLGNDNRYIDLNSDLKNVGGTLGFSAIKSQWGFYVEGTGLSLVRKASSSSEILKTTVRHSITEVGAVYRLVPVLDLLAGARHQGIGFKLKESDGTTPDDTTAFVDGFAGVKIGRFAPTDRWLYWAEGDVGAGDSDLVWNLRVETGYRFTERFYVAASFRYLDTDFEDDDFRYDGALKTMGLVVGCFF